MSDSGNMIRGALLNIDPYDFEHLVAKIWEKQGWEAEVTSSSQDRGIDVIAKKHKPISLTIAIQAKAYSPDNKVNSNEVRKYQTLYKQRDEVDAVTIVTTGKATAQAESLAEDLNVRLLDISDVTRLLASIDIVTFSRIVSPIDPEEYNLVDIPHMSSKDGCPECSTSGTLCEAELERNRHILVCEDCDATWQAKDNQGWTKIN